MRKLALLTTTAVAALALTATSASAATQVRDAQGNLCPAVSPAINATNAAPGSTTRNYVSGGCTLRMNSTAVNGHRIYVDSAPNYVDCQSQFDIHVGPDGWGYAENLGYSNCVGGGQPLQCAGDRLIAPAEYVGPNSFLRVFRFADAATDLNIELCGSYAGSTRWGYASMDITYPAGGGWKWTNQYDLADAWGTTYYSPQNHRGGTWTSPNNGKLQITH